MTASKARRAIDGRIEFPRYYGLARPPLRPLKHEVVVGGFDIEADAKTADPYLICADLSDNKVFRKTLTDAHDVLHFLTQPSFQQSINGFWNISYDSEGMLRFFPDYVKYLLSNNPEVHLRQDLSHGNKKDWFYHIKLIPKKALFVRTLVSPVNRFFDFAQFFDKEPLRKVARRLLNDDKEDFDASKSSIQDYFNNPEYRAKVQSYCLHDANITRRIGEVLVASIHNPPISLPTKNFTSRASISEQYFLRNGYSVPPQIMYLYKPFQRTYWGGRFEMTKCGFIPDTFTSDITSAYPARMAKLPILTDTVTAQQVKQDDYSKDALYGAYRVNVQVPQDDYLGPVPVEQNGPIYYPVGDINNIWIDKQTLMYLHRKDYTFQILEGQELFDPNAYPRLEKPIHDLFSIKSNKKNDEGIRNTSKIIMNGGYGKTIALIDDTVGEIMDLLTAQQSGYSIEKILPEGVYATKHTNVFRAGSMFCPPYAADITASTRIQVLEMAELCGFENTVAIQTDSITTVNVQPPEQKGLGGWERKYNGQPTDLSLGKPGFYQFLETGNRDMNPQWKIFDKPIDTKARGFGHLSDIAQLEYLVRRRISMKESAQRQDFTQQNIITTRPIQSNVNSDRKRLWHGQITHDDLRPWGRTVDSSALVHS